MVGDPDRRATGFRVGQLPKVSVITPGGKDTYEDDTKTRVTIRDQPARQQVSASGASQSQPITPRRRKYTRRQTGNSSRAIQTHTVYTECAGRARLVVTRGKGKDGAAQIYQIGFMAIVVVIPASNGICP